MIRTSISIFQNEPLVPLDDRQLQAAADSHDYALAHDLVLALETDDHLQYHYGIAADEQHRIPGVERSLADDHLPPLVLPPTKIDELWTVPRRVAVVLEAACRWLDEDELKACEEAVVSKPLGKSTKSPAETARTLKFEKPLLLADPDEDCAELEKKTTAALSCGEDCVRNHGIAASQTEEQDLFAIPIDASIYASRLEEAIRTETMVVSEQSIRSLMSLMSIMEWTEKDQAAFVEQQTVAPTLIRRYVSPPLPPVDNFEYFVPSGDVCLVSDASDISSGISEALEEAEKLLGDPSKDVWTDEGVVLDMKPFPDYTFDDSMDMLCSQLPIHTFKTKHEGDLSMSLSSISSYEAPYIEPEPEAMTQDDDLFSAWLNETMLEDDEGKNEEPIQRLPDQPEAVGVEVTAQSFVQDDSDADFQDVGYEDLTVDALFALEENPTIIQAKIPVPYVGIESSLPPWKDVGGCATDMFQCITANIDAAFGNLEWVTENDHQDNQRFEAHVDTLNSQYANLFTETLEINFECLEEVKVWMKDKPDSHSMLINSIKSAVLDQKASDEEPLKVPKDKPKEIMAPEVNIPEVIVKSETKPKPTESVQSSPAFSTPSVKPSQKEKPAHKSPHKDANSPFGDLMSRHKKRKKEHNSELATQTSQDTPTSQKDVQIKSMDLMLGFRAFAGPPMDTSQDGAASDGAVQPPDTTQALSIIIEKGPVVRPLETGVSRLPKAILSMAMPRSLRTILTELLPSLDFVERDYDQDHIGFDGINTKDEADLTVSPSTGIIMATMVSLRQTDAQKRLVFQSRVATIAPRYKALHILIYRNNARPIRDNAGADTRDELPELSPSDAMALAQLLGFAHSLPCKVMASYIGGGEQAVAECAASLVVDAAKNDTGWKAAEKYLVEEETRDEIFLRQAGLNVYDAQIVLGVLQDMVGSKRTSHVPDEGDLIRRYIEMSPKDRLQRLGTLVGCPDALKAVEKLLS